MKIQLIKAPTKNTGMPENDWYTPLNLIWLANYLIPYGFDVEILDGQLLSLKEIIAKISADIIGVSFDILSIEEFDSIIKKAKQLGSFTLAGGHLATALGSALLKWNSDLDVVVCYDGEEALLGIINSIVSGNNEKEHIPNILHRQRGKIIENYRNEVNLTSLQLPKREIPGINLEEYFHNYQSVKKKYRLPFKYNRPTNSYSHKGCPFRINGRGCSFCSRVDSVLRQKSASQVYEEYKYLVEMYAVDYISDFSDSWVLTKFLRQLAKQYDIKGNIEANLRVYGDVRFITHENVEIMRHIGVDTVLIGIESGNDNILKLNGKPITKKQILSAVKILATKGIKVSDAYILGLVGETRESVQDTIMLANEIRQICETEISYWNIMTPLPGSQVWNYLLAMGNVDVENNHHLNTEILEQIAISKLCNLGSTGYEYLLEVREEMLTKSKISSAEFVTREDYFNSRIE